MNKFYLWYRGVYWFSWWVVGVGFLAGVMLSAILFLLF